MWHPFRSPIADKGDPNEVGPDEWNARHKERSGSVTLVAGSGSVVFSSLSGGSPFNSAEADTSYQILLTGNADEVFHWESKATTGFTVKSSNPFSTATVDWKVARA